ncbi:GH12296 [Drosophila grimshawi]|uniref:GH12296 n=1 Tax=Drosophila grimshawi TaxID=7222 RepID=B4K057_DROGR|nr:GH12296 [Drosophila grimshawi]
MKSETDSSLFTKVWISNKKLNGLLDTVSLLMGGHGGADLVKELGLDLHKACSTIQTAGGSPHRIMGKIRTAVTYNGITKDIDLFVCPSLRQPLYLGVDFWRRFGLAPHIEGVEGDVEVVDKIELEQFSKSHPTEPHNLSREKQEQLDRVKANGDRSLNLVQAGHRWKNTKFDLSRIHYR